MTDPTPEEPTEPVPPAEECPSLYPRDSAIRCELDAGHNPRRLHCRSTGGPDSPYYEWE